jgi:hypothetical protein
MPKLQMSGSKPLYMKLNLLKIRISSLIQVSLSRKFRGLFAMTDRTEPVVTSQLRRELVSAFSLYEFDTDAY